MILIRITNLSVSQFVNESFRLFFVNWISWFREKKHIWNNPIYNIPEITLYQIYTGGTGEVDGFWKDLTQKNDLHVKNDMGCVFQKHHISKYIVETIGVSGLCDLFRLMIILMMQRWKKSINVGK